MQTKINMSISYLLRFLLGGYGLIVFSLKLKKSWRVSHNYFHLEPHAGDFFVGGYRYSWSDGIFSVEPSAINADGYRYLYFHAMYGTHMYRVNTRILRNETLATRFNHGDDFEVSKQVFNTQY